MSAAPITCAHWPSSTKYLRWIDRHNAPIGRGWCPSPILGKGTRSSELGAHRDPPGHCHPRRSEEHTSELQSLMRISYAVFCLKTKKQKITQYITTKNIL